MNSLGQLSSCTAQPIPVTRAPETLPKQSARARGNLTVTGPGELPFFGCSSERRFFGALTPLPQKAARKMFRLPLPSAHIRFPRRCVQGEPASLCDFRGVTGFLRNCLPEVQSSVDFTSADVIM